MKERLVTAAIVPALMDMSIQNRVPAEVIFTRANLDPAVVNQSGTFISVEQLLHVVEAAIEESKAEDFGLQLGETIHYQSMDIVGQLIATSATLGEAFGSLMQFKDLIFPYINFGLEFDKNNVVISYSMDSNLVTQHLATHHEIIAAGMLSIGKAVLPRMPKLEKICFAHATPSYADVYERVFDAPIEFNCSKNQVYFDKSELELKLLTSYPDYHESLKKMAVEKLKAIASYESLSDKVVSYISGHFGDTSSPLEEVAEKFNMTPRTLQRKLKQEGTSFLRLRDSCRHNRALRELGNPHIEIDSLAELLGFSDTTNFYHAFKRWQGEAPGEYRKRVLAAAGESDGQ